MPPDDDQVSDRPGPVPSVATTSWGPMAKPARFLREATYVDGPWSDAGTASVWGLSQPLAAAVSMVRLGTLDPTDLEPLLDVLERYRIGEAYGPFPGDANRYYDDNAWIGLDLVGVHLATGDPEALAGRPARARVPARGRAPPRRGPVGRAVRLAPQHLLHRTQRAAGAVGPRPHRRSRRAGVRRAVPGVPGRHAPDRRPALRRQHRPGRSHRPGHLLVQPGHARRRRRPVPPGHRRRRLPRCDARRGAGVARALRRRRPPLDARAVLQRHLAAQPRDARRRPPGARAVGRCSTATSNGSGPRAATRRPAGSPRAASAPTSGAACSTRAAWRRSWPCRRTRGTWPRRSSDGRRPAVRRELRGGRRRPPARTTAGGSGAGRRVTSARPGAAAPRTMPAMVALARYSRSFTRMLPESMSGTSTMSTSPLTGDSMPLMRADSAEMAPSNASGPSTSAPWIWPAIGHLRQARGVDGGRDGGVDGLDRRQRRHLRHVDAQRADEADRVVDDGGLGGEVRADVDRGIGDREELVVGRQLDQEDVRARGARCAGGSAPGA